MNNFSDFARFVSGAPFEGAWGQQEYALPTWVVSEPDASGFSEPFTEEDVLSYFSANYYEENCEAILGELRDGRYFFISVRFDYSFEDGSPRFILNPI